MTLEDALREFNRYGNHIWVTVFSRNVQHHVNGTGRKLQKMKRNTVYIGIDPGTNTGVGFITPEGQGTKAVKIHVAMDFVARKAQSGAKMHLRIEDARKRKKFGDNAVEKQQGAGSIKRDCGIWEDFLCDLSKTYPNQITYEFLHPQKGMTKLSQGQFKRLTGISKRTNEHSRDAFMLVYGFKKKGWGV